MTVCNDLKKVMSLISLEFALTYCLSELKLRFLVITMNCVSLPDLDNSVTIFSLRTVGKLYPDFKGLNF